MKKKILLISITYLLTGPIFYEILDKQFFQFLFENGFEDILKLVFVGNNDKLNVHVAAADKNFYNIYFGTGLVFLSLFFIFNFKKILFTKNFLLHSIDLGSQKLNRNELLIKIILATALSLFLELSIIRIQSSYLHFFSFLKNISLISCFLGLGIGYAIKTRTLTSLNWVFPLIAVQILILYFFSQTPISTVLINPIAEQFTMGIDTARSISHLFIIYFFILFIFILNALCFIPLGNLISFLMSKINTLESYSYNLLGSLIGIVLFIIFSFLSTTPMVWIIFSMILFIFIIKEHLKEFKFSILIVFFLSIILSLNIKGHKETIYSPYQNISIKEIKSPINPIIIQTGHVFYQAILNLSDELLFTRENEVGDIRIMGDRINKTHEKEFYNLPYSIKKNKPEKILIVGSGAGNDVASANRFNIKNITAVEIDPIILDLGKRYHPENPYNFENVETEVNDARNYISDTNNKFDAIVYALLDSQTNLSSKGGIRLDSYVYTVEAFQEAKNKLNKNGYIYLSFFVQEKLLGYKIYKMLETAFNKKPLVLKSKANDRYIFLASENFDDFNFDHLQFFKINKEFEESTYKVDLSTDDWPFLYMPKKIYPLTYLSIVLTLLLSSVFFVNKFFKINKKNFSLSCFFLGAGFMLIETKSITEIAKYYGSTWLVTSFVIITILIMAFIANLMIIKKINITSKQIYSLLIGSIILGYYLFIKNYIFIDKDFLYLIVPILLSLPLLFSGLAFSNELKKINSVPKALSSNILGAMFGGFLEYNSMYFGLSSLYLLACLIYFFAFISSIYEA